MSDIYIEVGDSKYLLDEYYFSPNIDYPEYLFKNDTLSKKQNNIYDMVRNCLIGLQMDHKNIGSRKWNPFKEIISEGDIVVLKPNLIIY